MQEYNYWEKPYPIVGTHVYVWVKGPRGKRDWRLGKVVSEHKVQLQIGYDKVGPTNGPTKWKEAILGG